MKTLRSTITLLFCICCTVGWAFFSSYERFCFTLFKEGTCWGMSSISFKWPTIVPFHHWCVNDMKCPGLSSVIYTRRCFGGGGDGLHMLQSTLVSICSCAYNGENSWHLPLNSNWMWGVGLGSACVVSFYILFIYKYA